MAKCKYWHRCLFRNQLADISPPMARYIEKLFCLTSSRLCARNKVAVVGGIELVPASLSPLSLEQAMQILEKLQRQIVQ